MRHACLAVVVVAFGLFAFADPPASAGLRPFALPDGEYGLDQVLDAFEKQYGVSFDRARANSQTRIKLAFKDEPYWPALERIAREFDLRVAFGESGRKPVLMAGDQVTYKQLPQSLDERFALKAKRVQGVRDLEQERALCEVMIDFRWLPNMNVFLIESPGGAVTAKDNAGKPLAVADPGKSRIAASGGGNQLTIRLEDVPRAAKSVKEIAGSFTVIGTEAMHDFDFDQLGDRKPKDQSKEGVQVQLVCDMKEGGELWTARVQITNPPNGPEFESFEASAWTIENEAILVSRDGKVRIPCNGGYELDTPSERQARFTYRFVDQEDRKLGKPGDWKLVVRTPGKLVEWPVKFKLENIELP